jgi:hypothetical protein
VKPDPLEGLCSTVCSLRAFVSPCYCVAWGWIGPLAPGPTLPHPMLVQKMKRVSDFSLKGGQPFHTKLGGGPPPPSTKSQQPEYPGQQAATAAQMLALLGVVALLAGRPATAAGGPSGCSECTYLPRINLSTQWPKGLALVETGVAWMMGVTPVISESTDMSPGQVSAVAANASLCLCFDNEPAQCGPLATVRMPPLDVSFGSGLHVFRACMGLPGSPTCTLPRATHRDPAVWYVAFISVRFMQAVVIVVAYSARFVSYPVRHPIFTGPGRAWRLGAVDTRPSSHPPSADAHPLPHVPWPLLSAVAFVSLGCWFAVYWRCRDRDSLAMDTSDSVEQGPLEPFPPGSNWASTRCVR